MIKPDGVMRGLVGEVIGRLERRGLKLVGMKMVQLSRPEAEALYEVHKGKPFFVSLVDYVVRGPVVLMVWEGPSSVRLVRNLMGALEPTEALPGSIRGDLTISKSMNIIHGSDSPDNAVREINLFFKKDDLLQYRRCDEDWLKTEGH